jgi:hypothetical protein
MYRVCKLRTELCVHVQRRPTRVRKMCTADPRYTRIVEIYTVSYAA